MMEAPRILYGMRRGLALPSMRASKKDVRYARRMVSSRRDMVYGGRGSEVFA